MSQPDLLAELREARPVAPAELREHIRAIAAEARPARGGTSTWRRALVVAVPLAAAIAGAAILLPGGKPHREPTARGRVRAPTPATHASRGRSSAQAQKARRASRPRRPAPACRHSATRRDVPAPSPNRVQRITTSLELRVPNTQAVSDGTKKAVAIAHALGGYPSSLNVQAAERTGYAEIVLRIPKQNVQRAVSRLSALGHDRRRERRDQGHHQARSTRPPARSRGSRRGSPTGRPSPRATRQPATSRRSPRRSRS